MKKILKKYGFLIVVVIANFLVLIYYPCTGPIALEFTRKSFINFLFMLTPIFICIGLLDVWIECDTMIRIMGDRSSFKGIVVALFLGMVTAVPLYALLPAAGILLKKGSRISNVLIFLCASASVRIPLLLFEISALGLRFTLVRFGLNAVVIFAIALIVENSLSSKDKNAIYESANK